MKKNLLLIVSCSLFLVPYALSQNVGIGTPNPLNKLHVGGGFRLDTLTGVGGAGLLRHDANGVVYGIKFSGNTNDVLRGDGSFGAFNINGAVGWLLNGNSGTNPATNFIGTTDNIPFNIRVNNLRSGLIELTSGNTSWGYQSLLSNTSGARNTAVGNEALSRNVLGNDNTAVGYNALFQNIGAGNSQEPIPFRGIQNTAVGSGALYANVSGSGNSAFGASALSLAHGSQSSAFGAFALEKNASLNSSGFGYNALRNNTTGNNNSGFGAYALFTNTTGSQNVAVGLSALNNNSTGSYNTAVGYEALALNTSNQNSALGYNALRNNVIGQYNCAFGSGASENNQNGDFNSAFGAGALSTNTTAYNSAFGYGALKLNADGLGNTGVGVQALYNNTTGAFNTAIGLNAGFGLPNNVSNVTCIGASTGWNTTSSNQVNIGDFSVTWIGGQTGWFHYSDKRIKNNIKDDVPGLAFITRLKPVTYNVSVDKQEEIANAGKKPDSEKLKQTAQKNRESKYDVEKIRMTGFFAQDVEEAANSINYSFSGVHNPKNGGVYSLDYSAFVVPLVKAVQEQQKIIEDQNKKIDNQQQQIDLLIKEMQNLKKDLITQKN